MLRGVNPLHDALPSAPPPLLLRPLDLDRRRGRVALARPAAPAAVAPTTSPRALLPSRAAAFLVDVTAVAAVALVFAGLAARLTHARLDALGQALAPLAGLFAVLLALYFAFCAALLRGHTLGLHALGLRVVDTTGAAPSPQRALARVGCLAVSLATFGAGALLALVDPRGHALHDTVTSTTVTRG